MPKGSSHRPPQPRGGTGMVIAGVAVIAVTYGLARYGYGLYLPQFRAAFDLSASTAGAIAAGGYIGYCGAAVVAGGLAGRGRARVALWLAGGSAALGSLLVASAWNGASLAVGALIAGSGAGAATPALVAAVAGTVALPDQPRAQGLVNGGTGAGVVVGGLLVLAAPEVWRWSWAGFAVAALLVTGWADRRSRWLPEQGGPAPGGVAAPDAGVPLRQLSRPLAAALLAGAGCAGVWTFARDLMIAHGGLSSAVTGLLWCVLGAAGLLGGLSGVLVGRVGLRAAWIGTVLVAAAGTASLGALPGAVLPAALALFCFGSSFVALSGVLLAWGAERAPAAAAAAAAVLFIGLTVGQAVGAVGLGLVAGTAGAPSAFLVAGALLVLAAAGAEGRPQGSGGAPGEWPGHAVGAGAPSGVPARRPAGEP